jgi:hypothetical protein
MSEEEQVVEIAVDEVKEEQDEETAQAGQTVTEEIKVQAEDLFETLNGIIREGTAKRVTIMRNDRVLVDIPMVLGIGASLVMAWYMPIITAVVGVGALLTGCTVRIEREEPKDED